MKTLKKFEENSINNNEMLLVKGGTGETEPISHTEEEDPGIAEGE